MAYSGLGSLIFIDDVTHDDRENVLDWPSPCPDLNPIEHAFYLLKRRLEREKKKNTTTERG